MGSVKFQKTLSLFLAFLILGNVALVPLAEASIWEERRKTVVASLPAPVSPISNNAASLLKNLPPASPAKTTETWRGLRLSVPLSKTIREIPLTSANIQDVYDSGRDQSAPVVLLQDVHLNFEAQSNLSSVLLQLINNEQAGAIGIEGAFTEFYFSRLRSVADKNIKKKAAEEFLNKNLIGAHTYAGILSDKEPPQMTGVDDPASYERNVQAYLDSRDVKNKTLKQLKVIERDLSEKKANAFSEELKNFDELRTGYNKGTVGLGMYVKKLSQLGAETDFTIDQFLEASQMESSMDFNRVELERKSVIEKLTGAMTEKEMAELLAQSLAYRSGRLGFGTYYRGLKDLCEKKGVSLRKTPAFDEYVRYVLLSDSIKADKLFAAIKMMEADILSALIKTPEQRELIVASHHMSLTQKLIEFSLTPDEWGEYNRLKTSADRIPSSDGMTILKPFETFYEQADIRSHKMLDNLFSKNKTTGKPLVLFTGGFHTPQIAKLLRDRKISYVTVSPKVTKIDEGSGSAYLSVFAREKNPIEKIFSGSKLFIQLGRVGAVAALPLQNAGARASDELKKAADTTARLEKAEGLPAIPPRLIIPTVAPLTNSILERIEQSLFNLLLKYRSFRSLIASHYLNRANREQEDYFMRHRTGLFWVLIYAEYTQLKIQQELRDEPLTMSPSLLRQNNFLSRLNLSDRNDLERFLVTLATRIKDASQAQFYLRTYLYGCSEEMDRRVTELLKQRIARPLGADEGAASFEWEVVAGAPASSAMVRGPGDSMSSPFTDPNLLFLIAEKSFPWRTALLNDLVEDLEQAGRKGKRLFPAIPWSSNFIFNFYLGNALKFHAIIQEDNGVEPTFPVESSFEKKLPEELRGFIIDVVSLRSRVDSKTALGFLGRSIVVPILEGVGLPGFGMALIPVLGPVFGIVAAGVIFALLHGLPGHDQTPKQLFIRSLAAITINGFAFSPIFFDSAFIHLYAQQFFTGLIFHGLWNARAPESWRLTLDAHDPREMRPAERNEKFVTNLSIKLAGGLRNREFSTRDINSVLVRKGPLTGIPLYPKLSVIHTILSSHFGKTRLTDNEWKLVERASRGISASHMPIGYFEDEADLMEDIDEELQRTNRLLTTDRIRYFAAHLRAIVISEHDEGDDLLAHLIKRWKSLNLSKDEDLENMLVGALSDADLSGPAFLLMKSWLADGGSATEARVFRKIGARLSSENVAVHHIPMIIEGEENLPDDVRLAVRAQAEPEFKETVVAAYNSPLTFPILTLLAEAKTFDSPRGKLLMEIAVDAQRPREKREFSTIYWDPTVQRIVRNIVIRIVRKNKTSTITPTLMLPVWNWVPVHIREQFWFRSLLVPAVESLGLPGFALMFDLVMPWWAASIAGGILFALLHGRQSKESFLVRSGVSIAISALSFFFLDGRMVLDLVTNFQFFSLFALAFPALYAHGDWNYTAPKEWRLGLMGSPVPSRQTRAAAEKIILTPSVLESEPALATPAVTDLVLSSLHHELWPVRIAAVKALPALFKAVPQLPRSKILTEVRESLSDKVGDDMVAKALEEAVTLVDLIPAEVRPRQVKTKQPRVKVDLEVAPVEGEPRNLTLEAGRNERTKFLTDLPFFLNANPNAVLDNPLIRRFLDFQNMDLRSAEYEIFLQQINLLADLILKTRDKYPLTFLNFLSDLVVLHGPHSNPQLESLIFALVQVGALSDQEAQRIVGAQMSWWINKHFAVFPQGTAAGLQFKILGVLDQGRHALELEWENSSSRHSYQRGKIKDKKGLTHEFVTYRGEVTNDHPGLLADDNGTGGVQVYRVGDQNFKRNVMRMRQKDGTFVHIAFIGFELNLSYAFYQVVESGVVFAAAIPAPSRVPRPLTIHDATFKVKNLLTEFEANLRNPTAASVGFKLAPAPKSILLENLLMADFQLGPVSSALLKEIRIPLKNPGINLLIEYFCRTLAAQAGVELKTNDLESISIDEKLRRMDAAVSSLFETAAELGEASRVLTLSQVNEVKRAGETIGSKNAAPFGHGPVFKSVTAATNPHGQKIRIKNKPYVTVRLDEKLSEKLGLKGRTKLMAQGETVEEALASIGIDSLPSHVIVNKTWKNLKIKNRSKVVHFIDASEGNAPAFLETQKVETAGTLMLPIWNWVPERIRDQFWFRSIIVPLGEFWGMPGFALILNIWMPAELAILLGGVIFAAIHGRQTQDAFIARTIAAVVFSSLAFLSLLNGQSFVDALLHLDFGALFNPGMTPSLIMHAAWNWLAPKEWWLTLNDPEPSPQKTGLNAEQLKPGKMYTSRKGIIQFVSVDGPGKKYRYKQISPVKENRVIGEISVKARATYDQIQRSAITEDIDPTVIFFDWPSEAGLQFALQSYKDIYSTDHILFLFGFTEFRERIQDPSPENKELREIYTGILKAQYPEDSKFDIAETINDLGFFITYGLRHEESSGSAHHVKDDGTRFKILKNILIDVLHQTGEDLVKSGVKKSFLRPGLGWPKPPTRLQLSRRMLIPRASYLPLMADRPFRRMLLEKGLTLWIPTEEYNQSLRVPADVDQYFNQLLIEEHLTVSPSQKYKPFSDNIVLGMDTYYPVGSLLPGDRWFSKKILDLKENPDAGTAPEIAAEMVDRYREKIEKAVPLDQIDLVMPIPSNPGKSNQVIHLVNALMTRFPQLNGKRSRNLLKPAEKPTQKFQKTFSGRVGNVFGAFKLKDKSEKEIKGKVVLLVDDVSTTGATLFEAQRLLYEAGAKKVILLSFGKTVDKNDVTFDDPVQILPQDQPVDNTSNAPIQNPTGDHWPMLKWYAPMLDSDNPMEQQIGIEEMRTSLGNYPEDLRTLLTKIIQVGTLSNNHFVRGAALRAGIELAPNDTRVRSWARKALLSSDEEPRSIGMLVAGWIHSIKNNSTTITAEDLKVIYQALLQEDERAGPVVELLGYLLLPNKSLTADELKKNPVISERLTSLSTSQFEKTAAMASFILRCLSKNEISEEDRARFNTIKNSFRLTNVPKVELERGEKIRLGQIIRSSKRPREIVLSQFIEDDARVIFWGRQNETTLTESFFSDVLHVIDNAGVKTIALPLEVNTPRADFVKGWMKIVVAKNPDAFERTVREFLAILDQKKIQIILMGAIPSQPEDITAVSAAEEIRKAAKQGRVLVLGGSIEASRSLIRGNDDGFTATGSVGAILGAEYNLRVRFNFEQTALDVEYNDQFSGYGLASVFEDEKKSFGFDIPGSPLEHLRAEPVDSENTFGENFDTFLYRSKHDGGSDGDRDQRENGPQVGGRKVPQLAGKPFSILQHAIVAGIFSAAAGLAVAALNHTFSLHGVVPVGGFLAAAAVIFVGAVWGTAISWGGLLGSLVMALAPKNIGTDEKLKQEIADRLPANTQVVFLNQPASRWWRLAETNGREVRISHYLYMDAQGRPLFAYLRKLLLPLVLAHEEMRLNRTSAFMIFFKKPFSLLARPSIPSIIRIFESDVVDDPLVNLTPHYRVSKDTYWRYSPNLIRNGEHLQGWKFHITTTEEDAGLILEAVLGSLIELKIPHKIVNGMGLMNILNNQLDPQAGKNITAYIEPLNVEALANQYPRLREVAIAEKVLLEDVVARFVALRLDRSLTALNLDPVFLPAWKIKENNKERQFNGPSLGKNGLMHGRLRMRYGSFTDEVLVLKDGHITEDRRDIRKHPGIANTQTGLTSVVHLNEVERSLIENKKVSDTALRVIEETPSPEYRDSLARLAAREKIIRENIRLFAAQKFGEAERTSKNKNRTDYLEVTAIIEKNGRMVAFGNREQLPEAIREKINKKELFDFQVLVKINLRAAGQLYEPRWHFPSPDAQYVLPKTFRRLNRGEEMVKNGFVAAPPTNTNFYRSRSQQSASADAARANLPKLREAFGNAYEFIAGRRDLRQARVLDLATGHGAFLKEGLQRGIAEAVGVDVSAEMLQLAHQSLSEVTGAVKPLLVQADITKLSLSLMDQLRDPSGFTLVTIGNVLGLQSKKEMGQILEGAKAVLEPGGDILIVSSRELDEAYVKMLTEHGFIDARFIGKVDERLVDHFEGVPGRELVDDKIVNEYLIYHAQKPAEVAVPTNSGATLTLPGIGLIGMGAIFESAWMAGLGIFVVGVTLLALSAKFFSRQERLVPDESRFMNRRNFLRTVGLAGAYTFLFTQIPDEAFGQGKKMEPRREPLDKRSEDIFRQEIIALTRTHINAYRRDLTAGTDDPKKLFEQHISPLIRIYLINWDIIPTMRAEYSGKQLEGVDSPEIFDLVRKWFNSHNLYFELHTTAKTINGTYHPFVEDIIIGQKSDVPASLKVSLPGLNTDVDYIGISYWLIPPYTNTANNRGEYEAAWAGKYNDRQVIVYDLRSGADFARKIWTAADKMKHLSDNELLQRMENRNDFSNALLSIHIYLFRKQFGENLNLTEDEFIEKYKVDLMAPVGYHESGHLLVIQNNSLPNSISSQQAGIFHEAEAGFASLAFGPYLYSTFSEILEWVQYKGAFPDANGLILSAVISTYHSLNPRLVVPADANGSDPDRMATFYLSKIARLSEPELKKLFQLSLAAYRLKNYRKVQLQVPQTNSIPAEKSIPRTNDVPSKSGTLFTAPGLGLFAMGMTIGSYFLIGLGVFAFAASILIFSAKRSGRPAWVARWLERKNPPKPEFTTGETFKNLNELTAAISKEIEQKEGDIPLERIRFYANWLRNSPVHDSKNAARRERNLRWKQLDLSVNVQLEGFLVGALTDFNLSMPAYLLLESWVHQMGPRTEENVVNQLDAQLSSPVAFYDINDVSMNYLDERPAQVGAVERAEGKMDPEALRQEKAKYLASPLRPFVIRFLTHADDFNDPRAQLISKIRRDYDRSERDRDYPLIFWSTTINESGQPFDVIKLVKDAIEVIKLRMTNDWTMETEQAIGDTDQQAPYANEFKPTKPPIPDLIERINNESALHPLSEDRIREYTRELKLLALVAHSNDSLREKELQTLAALEISDDRSLESFLVAALTDYQFDSIADPLLRNWLIQRDKFNRDTEARVTDKLAEKLKEPTGGVGIEDLMDPPLFAHTHEEHGDVMDEFQKLDEYRKKNTRLTRGAINFLGHADSLGTKRGMLLVFLFRDINNPKHKREYRGVLWPKDYFQMVEAILRELDSSRGKGGTTLTVPGLGFFALGTVLGSTLIAGIGVFVFAISIWILSRQFQKKPKQSDSENHLIKLVRTHNADRKKLLAELVSSFGIKAEPIGVGEMTSMSSGADNTEALNVVNKFGKTLRAMILMGDLTPDEAREVATTLAMALSVAFTEDKYAGFIGSIEDLLKPAKKGAPVDIIGVPANLAEAQEVIDSAVGEQGNLKSGYRLAICLNSDKTGLQQELKKKLDAKFFKQIIFIEMGKLPVFAKAVDVLREIDEQSQKINQQTPIRSGTRTRQFFVSENIRLADDFFNLKKMGLDGYMYDQLLTSLHVYMILKDLMVAEIPKTHLPNFNAIRKALISA